MNQTFNIHRFTLSLQLELAEKGKTYFFTALLLLSLLGMLMLPLAFSKEYSNMKELAQILALFMIILFGSSLYSISAFSQYGDSSTGIAAIMVPASRTEKFLSALVLNLIFVIPFAFAYWKLHYWSVEYANAHIPANAHKYNALPEPVIRYALQYYFMIHAFVFLGSLYFTKASYLKTAATFIASFLFIALLHLGIGNLLTGFPSKLVSFPITGWDIWFWPDGTAAGPKSTQFYQVKLPETVHTFIQIFPAIIVFALWSATYFRLREKEI
ncbi:hypothetical protein [Dyadobacter luticola]|uniref:Uncharacterized protein n=1 Tax=Dyadobacter luticola TaxID=1979387 RepID=A0A5R9KYC9_9BACT|nr:hypothetical protein [Dyadobacter luticola]TLV01283.1 hypothetical protein FEN17_17740 [Dyadobacter luticola]